MKKILVFDKGTLGEWYGQSSPEGGPLRARRLEQAGRLELVQVTNDPPPYWLVLIRNFNQAPNSVDRQAIGGPPYGNGVWRFLGFENAKAKFLELSALPIFVQEYAKAQKSREEKRERIKKAGTPFQKKEKTGTA
jgi:hypothetical protein